MNTMEVVSLPVYKPPTLTEVIVERIRAGVTLDEAKEYYRFVREVQMDEARAAFTAALVRAQQAMSTIARDMDNAQTRSRYASLGALDKAIREHYTAEGLAPTFDTRPSPRGEAWILIVLELAHTSGYSREYTVDMPADGIGAKGGQVMTRTHATISAVTYGRRALLKMAFNLAEADDDGNRASAKQFSPTETTTINEEQQEELSKMMEDFESEEFTLFLKVFRLDRLDQLPIRLFESAKNRIAIHRAKKGQK